jgi:hypothetical protein
LEPQVRVCLRIVQNRPLTACMGDARILGGVMVSRSGCHTGQGGSASADQQSMMTNLWVAVF